MGLLRADRRLGWGAVPGVFGQLDGGDRVASGHQQPDQDGPATLTGDVDVGAVGHDAQVSQYAELEHPPSSGHSGDGRP